MTHDTLIPSPDPLTELRARGGLTDLDWHFARLMTRLAALPNAEAGAYAWGARHSLELAAALASHASGQGDICVNLRQWAQRWQTLAEETPSFAPPPTAEWLSQLRASAVVGWPGQRQPLILDQRGRLYLYRYWRYEQRLAEDLLRRAGENLAIDAVRLQAELALLFPRHPQLVGPDWQKVAATVAALKRLCVISGGPGTGKTSTVLKILALLTGQNGERPLRIALAAPTGKAAARLQEAIRAAKAELPLSPERLAQIPEEASTLHRLLGARPDAVQFRYHRTNPLPVDVLVVDEVSMVGLALLAKTVDALPAQARLILLGDKDQLASVDAGAALGDICFGGDRFAPAFSAQLAALTGETLPRWRITPPPLADAIVLLRHSYRFSAGSGIGALARAINAGRTSEALALWLSPPQDDIAWRALPNPAALPTHLAESVAAGFAPYLQAVRAGAGPEVVFERFNQFRVLSALRGGPFGVEALNPLCETVLRARGLIQSRQDWYPGRPVMIVRNDYNLRLFNGDIGITLPDPADPERMRVFFLGSDGAVRAFAPARLPEYETVYAMTVHKSQGSEFAQVHVVTPPTTAPLLSRELLYTALTRAKQQAVFHGIPTVLAGAVGRRVRRSSGLRDRLWLEPRVGGR